MPLPTLLDVIKRNNSDAVVGLIDETLQEHPELQLGTARTIAGIQYKTRVRIALPEVGFRDANEGTDPVKSTSENRLVETHIIDARFEVDKAVADANEDGPMAYLAEEADAVMRGAFKTIAKQFYYGAGTGGHAKGHPGLIQSYNTKLEVDAEGTTDDTATSVWAVKWGRQAVRWVVGQNGRLAVSDPRIETIRDANNKALDGYVQTLLAWIGLQVGSINAVGRIKKITDDSGHTLSDDLLYKLLQKFEENGVGRPDVLFMTPRARTQLRNSRTATNATGAPAPLPTEFEGVQIQVTNSISNTEKLAL